jgi:hypothetical protein
VSRLGLSLVFGSLCVIGGCAQKAPSPPTPAAGAATPVYDKATGRLEALVSDRNGDGKPDARAVMDGTTLERIELDRNADGKTDRWEYYAPGATGKPPVIVRAEQAAGAAGRITRREFYKDGVIDHVEEDTNNDGRVDKWEQYADGALSRVDLDLQGKGYPNRRLVYDASGSVTAVEEDSHGDGTFVPLTAPGAAGSAAPATAR